MAAKISLSLLLAVTSISSLNLMANTLQKPYSFGAHIASGGAEFNDSEADGDGIVQVYGFYNYGVTQNFAIEVGLNVGVDVDEWDCYEDRHDDWHCTTANHDSLFGLGVDDVEYSNLVAAIKGVLPLNHRNSLYGKIGAQLYEYELRSNRHLLFEDDGVGLYLALGWQYEWDMGLGMSAGFERYEMDSLETTAANVGISYNF